MKTEVVNFIRKHNPNTYTENKTAPVLFSSTTNWEPWPLINMVDFLKTIGYDEDTPNFDHQIMSEARKKFEITDVMDLSDDMQ